MVVGFSRKRVVEDDIAIFIHGNIRNRSFISTFATQILGASQVASVVKNSPANGGDAGDMGCEDPQIRNIPWRRAWQPTPVFLSRESHGQRILVGYSP